MKTLNWIKEKWNDSVWSKVFALIIFAIIVQILRWFYQILNLLFTSKWIQDLFSRFNKWIGEESQISNFTLLLIFLFFGIIVTIAIYNLIAKWWIGRTEKFHASDQSYTVRGTYSVDLDFGIQAKGRTNADFFWQQKTKTERSIVPKNGAKFCVIGQSSKKRYKIDDLETLPFSSQEIKADDNHSNSIPTGTQIAYKTKQSRYGVMKILNYGYNLEIEFYTYNKENESTDD